MADPVTNNVSLTLPTIGGDVSTWGTPLNGDFTTIDALFGGNFSTAITAADVTLTTTQFQNGVFVVTGTLTGNRNLIVPFSTNFLSTTACGGKFVVVNSGAGAFNLSVKTATTGSSVTVPQGFAASLYSDGFNVKLAGDGLPGYALAANGTTALLPGTAASVNTNASIAYDYVNNKLYICTTSSTTAATYTLPITSTIPPTLFTPDVQVLTSGTGATYTSATNGGNRALYLRVRMVGGGGGGSSGGAGTNTSFASWTAVAGSGGGSGSGSSGGAGGSGGTNSTGTLIARIAGGAGQGGSGTANNQNAGGMGGASPFGGAGGGGNSGGTTAATNSGSGGGGSSSGSSSSSGGGAGEYVEFIITSPAATYTYTVGTGGGNGAAGRIEVIGYWQ